MEDSQSKTHTDAKPVGPWGIVRIRPLDNGKQQIEKLPEFLSSFLDWYLNPESDNNGDPEGEALLRNEIKKLEKYCQLSEPNSMEPLQQFFEELYIKKPDTIANPPEPEESSTDQPELNYSEQLPSDSEIIDIDLFGYDLEDDLISPLSNNSDPFLSGACFPKKTQDSLSTQLVPYTGATRMRTPSPLPSACQRNGAVKPYRTKGKTAKTCRILENLYQTSPKGTPKTKPPQSPGEKGSSPSPLIVAIPSQSPGSSIKSPISKRTRSGAPKSPKSPLALAKKEPNILCPHANEGCPKQYSCKNGLKYHLTHHHLSIAQEEEQKKKLQNPKYCCGYPLCEKKYMNKSGLSYHQRTFDHSKLPIDGLTTGKSKSSPSRRRSIKHEPVAPTTVTSYPALKFEPSSQKISTSETAPRKDGDILKRIADEKRNDKKAAFFINLAEGDIMIQDVFSLDETHILPDEFKPVVVEHTESSKDLGREWRGNEDDFNVDLKFDIGNHEIKEERVTDDISEVEECDHVPTYIDPRRTQEDFAVFGTWTPGQCTSNPRVHSSKAFGETFITTFFCAVEKCKKSYKRPGDLKSHIRKKHDTSETKVYCVCGKQLLKMDNNVYHSDDLSKW